MSLKMFLLLFCEMFLVNALESANFGCRQVLSRGGYDVRGFIVLLGCVSTSAWLMALAEKSCHLNREKESEWTHTYVCVWERQTEGKKELLYKCWDPTTEKHTSHPPIFILSLSFCIFILLLLFLLHSFFVSSEKSD